MCDNKKKILYNITSHFLIIVDGSTRELASVIEREFDETSHRRRGSGARPCWLQKRSPTERQRSVREPASCHRFGPETRYESGVFLLGRAAGGLGNDQP